MKYKKIVKGKFLKRINRFVAHVEIDGEFHVVHVKNTGRCKELLTDGATVYLEESDNPSRKTKYDLVAVRKGNLLINMDSQAPNKVVGEWLTESCPWGKPTFIKAECTHGDSRFDFYVETEEEKIFVEVKGVTLERDGVVLFPDAPTERGVKHLNGLVKLIDEGYKTAVFFVIQMQGVKYFTPNRETHLEFANALVNAAHAGVEVLAYDCIVQEDGFVINEKVAVKL
ncbi:MAG: DNA/RNA nuclease SfsA [Phascolarctobacterium sp.]|nr:DNA/RNA nuclease SfsA [Phascolarctobacterium sp.]